MEVWHLMPRNKCKTVHNTHIRTKHMNCIVAVVIAILALVIIHVTNNFLEERIKICPKVSSRHLLIKQKGRFRLNDKRIKR